MVRIGQFFLDLGITDKLEFTAWFEVNPTFGSRAIIILKTGGLICPPPLIRIKSELDCKLGCSLTEK